MSAASEAPPPKSHTEKRMAPSPLPKELTEKVLAQRGRIEGERRQVTAMFCDLEGSPALTEKLGDEKASAPIDEIFGILTQRVHKYEGTVQEFRGDGIMALFGVRIRIGIHTGPDDSASLFFASQWLGYARSYCCEFETAS